ncbi:hypothetical protein ACFL21_03455 [Patescibacteria group bacterium]
MKSEFENLFGLVNVDSSEATEDDIDETISALNAVMELQGVRAHIENSFNFKEIIERELADNNSRIRQIIEELKGVQKQRDLITGAIEPTNEDIDYQNLSSDDPRREYFQYLLQTEYTGLSLAKDYLDQINEFIVTLMNDVVAEVTRLLSEQVSDLDLRMDQLRKALDSVGCDLDLPKISIQDSVPDESADEEPDFLDGIIDDPVEEVFDEVAADDEEDHFDETEDSSIEEVFDEVHAEENEDKEEHTGSGYLDYFESQVLPFLGESIPAGLQSLQQQVLQTTLKPYARGKKYDDLTNLVASELDELRDDPDVNQQFHLNLLSEYIDSDEFFECATKVFDRLIKYDLRLNVKETLKFEKDLSINDILEAQGAIMLSFVNFISQIIGIDPKHEKFPEIIQAFMGGLPFIISRGVSDMHHLVKFICEMHSDGLFEDEQAELTIDLFTQELIFKNLERDYQAYLALQDFVEGSEYDISIFFNKKKGYKEFFINTHKMVDKLNDLVVIFGGDKNKAIQALYHRTRLVNSSNILEKFAAYLLKGYEFADFVENPMKCINLVKKGDIEKFRKSGALEMKMRQLRGVTFEELNDENDINPDQLTLDGFQNLQSQIVVHEGKIHGNRAVEFQDLIKSANAKFDELKAKKEFGCDLIEDDEYFELAKKSFRRIFSFDWMFNARANGLHYPEFYDARKILKLQGKVLTKFINEILPSVGIEENHDDFPKIISAILAYLPNVVSGGMQNLDYLEKLLLRMKQDGLMSEDSKSTIPAFLSSKHIYNNLKNTNEAYIALTNFLNDCGRNISELFIDNKFAQIFKSPFGIAQKLDEIVIIYGGDRDLARDVLISSPSIISPANILERAATYVLLGFSIDDLRVGPTSKLVNFIKAKDVNNFRKSGRLKGKMDELRRLASS